MLGIIISSSFTRLADLKSITTGVSSTVTVTIRNKTKPITDALQALLLVPLLLVVLWK